MALQYTGEKRPSSIPYVTIYLMKDGTQKVILKVTDDCLRDHGGEGAAFRKASEKYAAGNFEPARGNDLPIIHVRTSDF